MRIRNLQALRAVAALGVILFHLDLWQRKIFGIGLFAPLSNGQAGVDFFFIISGFIMVFIQRGPIRSWRAYGHFMGHRISRVYPPLWAVMVPLLFFWMARPAWFNRGSDNRVEILRSFLLLPQHYQPLLTVSWTLVHEIYFYWIVSLALCFARKGRLIFGCTWFLAVVVAYLVVDPAEFHQRPLLQLVFSPFSLTFLLGYFIGLFYEGLQRLSAGVLWGLIFLGGALFLIRCSYLPALGFYPDNNLLSRFFFFGVPLSLIVAGAVALEKRVCLGNPVVQKWGDASYAIYLVHVLIIMAVFHLLEALHLHSYFLIVLGTLLCLASCLGGGMLFHLVIERPVFRAARNGIDKLIGWPSPEGGGPL